MSPSTRTWYARCSTGWTGIWGRFTRDSAGAHGPPIAGTATLSDHLAHPAPDPPLPLLVGRQQAVELLLALDPRGRAGQHPHVGHGPDRPRAGRHLQHLAV